MEQQARTISFDYKENLKNQLFLVLSTLLDGKFDRRTKQLANMLVEQRSDRIDYFYQCLLYIQREGSALLKDRCRDLLKLLLLTENPICSSLDTHPLGLHLSIFLYSEAAQKVLNVKHVLTGDSEEVNESNSERIIPKLDITHVYSHPKLHWIRCTLSGDTVKELTTYLNVCHILEEKLRDDHPTLNYSHFFLFPNTNVVEFYFKKPGRRSCQSVLAFFNEEPLVCDIIFYSESKILKGINLNEFLVLGNLLKFTYCYTQGYLTFRVQTDEDWRSLFFIFIQSLIFTYKDNLKSTGKDFSPLSLVTGENPQRNLFKYTTSSRDKEEYELRADREYRLFGLGSTIGSRNRHEIILSRDHLH